MDNTLPSEILKFNQVISKYFLVGSIGAFLGNILFEFLSDLHCSMDNRNVLVGGVTPPTTTAPTTGGTTAPVTSPTSAPTTGGTTAPVTSPSTSSTSKTLTHKERVDEL